MDEPQPGSPAAKAGIAAGDVITAVNGNDVKDSRDLARQVGGMAPGTDVKLALLHDGQQKTVDLKLGEMPNRQQASADQEQTQPSNGAPHLGLQLAPASEVDGAGDQGVAVLGVEPGSPAAEHGFKTGDLILDVSGKTVSRPSEVRDALVAAHQHGKHDVLMRVKTAEATRFIAVPLG